MNSEDLESFRLAPTQIVPTSSKPAPNRQVGKFILGPIPMSWLIRAANLPGKSPVLIGLMLFHLAGLRRTRERLSLSARQMKQFGIANSQTVRKALRALQQAGLVNIEQLPGRSRLVTILEPNLTEATAANNSAA